MRKLTFDNASARDLNDRGLVRTGSRADLVLFDADRVRPAMPTVETDLPGGARRLVQKAEGIAAVVVNGQLTLEDGKSTGTMPRTGSAFSSRSSARRVGRGRALDGRVRTSAPLRPGAVVDRHVVPADERQAQREHARGDAGAARCD